MLQGVIPHQLDYLHHLKFNICTVLDFPIVPSECLPVQNSWNVTYTAIIIMTTFLIWEAFGFLVMDRYVANAAF